LGCHHAEGRKNFVSDIKIFVVSHEDKKIPQNSLLYPIQAGAALTDKRFSGFLQDDEGENISAKNRSYCELTAQYWAWKNMSADYYGFFHYRRFLYPSPDVKRPYILGGGLNAAELKKLSFDSIREFIAQNDLICPMSERMYVSVYEHYKTAPAHHIEDVDLMRSIIAEREGKYLADFERYFSQDEMFFGNIYIMNKTCFFQYCEWLFPLLEEFDSRADVSKYSAQERRVDGYMAERLFGVFLNSEYGFKGNKKAFLPRVHFGSPAKQRAGYCLLPPGSRRRAYMKKIVKATF